MLGVTVKAVPIGFALQLYPSTRDDWLDRARQAEAAGFEALCVTDHPGISASPFVALAAAAQVTSRIALATSVANLGVRDVMQIVSDVSTLDQMSQGRAVLGVGTGHTESEWTALGKEYPSVAGRIARLREAVDAIIGLLAGETITFHGDHVELVNARLESPRPVQGRIPVLIGGYNPRVVTIAGQSADIAQFTGLGRTLEDGRSHEFLWNNEAVNQRVELFKDASASRSPAPRLGVTVQHVEVTDNRVEASERFLASLPPLLRTTGLPEAGSLSESPFVLIGSVSEIVDQLLDQRERWGFTHYLVRWPAVEPLRAVFERLHELGDF